MILIRLKLRHLPPIIGLQGENSAPFGTAGRKEAVS